MRAEQVPQGVGVPNASGHNASPAAPPRTVGKAKMVPLNPCPAATDCPGSRAARRRRTSARVCLLTLGTRTGLHGASGRSD